MSVAQHAFPGFEPLTGNFLYCPNQFFDVCLPHCSRGVVRLVALIIRRTLGWLDRDGNPIEQSVSISYSDLVATAGISRGAARTAIEEAIAGRFIQRTQQGRIGKRGVAAQPSGFELRWDSTGEFTKDIVKFQGFYAGEGHRTPVPNAFFDRAVPNETLAVVKVVGSVLRHTVGYQNQFGGRRSDAPLSYSYLQSYAGIGDRKTLAEALRVAMQKGYISRVTIGRFAPQSANRQSARYAIRWLSQASSHKPSPKTPPAPKQYKYPTSTSSESQPVDQSKNSTKKKTPSNDTNKQQQAAVDLSESIQLLRSEGFDRKAARHLAMIATLDEIQNQIAWIDLRKPENRLGMLRTAIGERWAEPEASKQHKAMQRSARMKQERQVIQDQNDAAIDEELQRDTKRREALLAVWPDRTKQERQRYHRTAIQEASSEFVRLHLRRHADLDNPPVATLEVMARSLELADIL